MFTHKKQSCWLVDGSPETCNPANVMAIVPQFAGANLFYSCLSPVGIYCMITLLAGIKQIVIVESTRLTQAVQDHLSMMLPEVLHIAQATDMFLKFSYRDDSNIVIIQLWQHTPSKSPAKEAKQVGNEGMSTCRFQVGVHLQLEGRGSRKWPTRGESSHWMGWKIKGTMCTLITFTQALPFAKPAYLGLILLAHCKSSLYRETHAEGIAPNLKKVDAVKGFPPSTCTKVSGWWATIGGLERLLHLCKLWQGRMLYSSGYTELKLKELLSSPPLWEYPDLDRPFVLQSDDSKVRLGAVLEQ